MAARTLSELEDELAEQVAWRRTELQSILTQIRATSGPAQRALCRGGIALLYAHWEGFTKFSLSLYLKYVARRKLVIDELQYCFVAMAMSAEMKRTVGLREGAGSVEQVRWLIEEGKRRANLSSLDPINTQSNLNSEVCERLLTSLGISNQPFKTKDKLIDYKLLKARNEIAHGEHVIVGSKDYEDLHFEVLGLIDTVRRLVVEAAENKLYRR